LSSVSVIVPTFRRASQVLGAVESALTQVPPPAEVLIVDDASPRSERPPRLSSERVRTIERPVNGGVAAASNTGLEAASGEFVCFLHSDDVLLPGKFASQVASLENEPLDVCASESGSIRERDGGSTTLPPRLLDTTPAGLFERQVPNVHITPFLFRRECLVSAGGFDSRLRCYEDFDLLVRLRRRYRISFVEEPTCVLRQHGEDRLVQSPWMQAAREYLLEKYSDDLRALPRMPVGWQQWAVEAAMVAFDCGDRRAARRHLLQSARGDVKASVRRSPLIAATYGPPRMGRAAAQAYESGSRARHRKRAGRAG
jgi:glycosyltransferase involved in cell wall biosynthesis